MRSIVFIVVIAFAAAASPQATAQTDLEIQNVGDSGPLDVDLFSRQPGLEEPSRFDQLYAVPGAPGLHMRVDGALYAVFPRSVYYGSVPIVPANTTYFIGAPDPRLVAQQYGVPDGDDAVGSRGGVTADDPRAPRRVAAYLPEGADAPVRVRTSVGDQRERTSTPLPPVERRFDSVVDDPEYRATRIRALLREAASGAQAARGPSPSSP